MKALITGAGSGIGKSMAIYLSNLGHNLILIDRNKEKLENLRPLLKTEAVNVVMDLANETKAKELYVLCKNENIDILINNAGFGVFGRFTKTELNSELQMIDVNIKAVHILTKLFLKDMQKRNSGYILNVASSAAFGPGPLMATYYATKAYIYRLSISINEELRRRQSRVVISCLCPGPVDTNFNNVAGVRFSIKALTSDYVAKYAIDQMFKKKLIIIPTFKMKCAKFFLRFIGDKTCAKITYNIQRKKKPEAIDNDTE